MRDLSNILVKTDIMNELVNATALDEKFSAAYAGWVQTFHRQNPNQGQKLLTCVAFDSRLIRTQSSLSFDHQKRTYTTRTNSNGLLKTGGAALDGSQKYIYVTSASISPSHTDESLCSHIVNLETNSGTSGGLKDMFLGHDGELRVNLLDRGYKSYIMAGGRMTFPAWCAQQEQLSNGRVIFRFPLDPGDIWYDRNGLPQPSPAKPPHLEHVNLMHEVVANSSRLMVLAHRYDLQCINKVCLKNRTLIN